MLSDELHASLSEDASATALLLRGLRLASQLPPTPMFGSRCSHQLVAAQTLALLIPTPERVQAVLFPKQVADPDPVMNLVPALLACHDALSDRAGRDRFVASIVLCRLVGWLLAAVTFLPPGTRGLVAVPRTLKRMQDGGIAKAAGIILGSNYAAVARRVAGSSGDEGAVCLSFACKVRPRFHLLPLFESILPLLTDIRTVQCLTPIRPLV